MNSTISVIITALLLALILYGCNGGTPENATVPNVIGMPFSEASEAIMEVGLTIDTPSIQYSDTKGTDRVIAQTPGGGMIVPRSSMVSLVVLREKVE